MALSLHTASPRTKSWVVAVDAAVLGAEAFALTAALSVALLATVGLAAMFAATALGITSAAPASATQVAVAAVAAWSATAALLSALHRATRRYAA